MKGQISRQSYSASKNYSGLYQVQGGMVTDADLGELSEIARIRTDQLGGDAVRSGVPASGGVVALGSVSALQPGVAYADGIRGVLTGNGYAPPAGAPFDPADPLQFYAKQADFPMPPAVAGAGVYYLDIWQRGVFALEDPLLTDVGLHGAETSFRGKTMAQIRWTPTQVGGVLARTMLDNGNGAFPRRGNAQLTTRLSADAEVTNECDPCADEIAGGDLRIPNALFRVEVVHVTGSASNPQRIELAWSRENAAEQYPFAVAGTRFPEPGVYEFFSTTTESHMGAFADSNARRRSAFDTRSMAQPARTDGGSGTWPYVRRWDGHAVFDLAGGATIAVTGGQASLNVASGARLVGIVSDSVTIDIDFRGKQVLAGDYWLVEMREFAADDDKARPLNEGLPVGIEHHYCVLLETNAAGQALPLSDRDRRRLSFPSLTDIPARNISLDPNTCDKLFRDAENVQDALSRLCEIEATDIAFDNKCEQLYGDARTVQEALQKLCGIDLGGARGYREMFDWGVVCGLDVRPIKADTEAVVRVTKGTYLNRAGQFTPYSGNEKLEPDDPEREHLDLNDADRVKRIGLPDNTKGEFCLSIALDENGKELFYLSKPDDKSLFIPDPGFCEKVTECQDTRGLFDNTIDLPATLDFELINKVKYAASDKETFYQSLSLTSDEFSKVELYVSAVAKAAEARSTPDDFKKFKAGIEAIDTKFAPLIRGGGEIADKRRSQKAIDLAAYLFDNGQARLRECVRNAIIVPCPPELGKAPYLVPLASVVMVIEGGKCFLQRIDITRCRKQALTLRAMRYRQRGGNENDLAWFEDYLNGKQYDQGQLLRTLGGFQNPNSFLKGDCLQNATNEKNIDPGVFEPEPGIVWPPKEPPWKVPPYIFEPDWVIDPPRPNVRDLVIEDARKVLTGNGGVVKQVINVEDGAEFDQLVGRLSPDAVRGGGVIGKFQPGDEIALLQRNGVAQGFVVLKKGDGFAFNTAGPAIAAPDVAVAPVIDQIAEATRAKDALTQDLDRLVTTRAGLAAEVEQMRAQMQTQMQEFKRLQTDAAEAVRKSSEELQVIVEQKDSFITAIETAIPATAIVTNRKLADRMVENGINNMHDILDDTKIDALVNIGTFKPEEIVLMRAGLPKIRR
ncbi:MAG: hypothetical protein WBA73_02875 [Devosia sp.]